MFKSALIHIKPWYEGFLSLFFPILCYGCSVPLSDANFVLCKKCLSELPRTNFENMPKNIVYKTFWGRVMIEFASSIYFYRKGELLQTLIHRLKYRNSPGVGLFLGRLAGQYILNSEYYSSVDLIVPVPLHLKKERKRGYNQALLIAEGLSEVLKIPCSKTLLSRDFYSESQTKKGHYERWKNVDGVFSVRYNEQDSHKHLLLVDDIITTGATLESCCQSLFTIPGVKISILTIGYAI